MRVVCQKRGFLIQTFIAKFNIWYCLTIACHFACFPVKCLGVAQTGIMLILNVLLQIMLLTIQRMATLAWKRLIRWMTQISKYEISKYDMVANILFEIFSVKLFVVALHSRLTRSRQSYVKILDVSLYTKCIKDMITIIRIW